MPDPGAVPPQAPAEQMTLRDQFAFAALPEAIKHAHHVARRDSAGGKGGFLWDFESLDISAAPGCTDVMAWAYRMADAAQVVRDGPPHKPEEASR